jgi:hypothetical protein
MQRLLKKIYFGIIRANHTYRNIKPTALSIFKEIKNLSNEERDKLLKYINDSDFINK